MTRKKEDVELDHMLAKGRIRDALASGMRWQENEFVVYVIVRRRTPSYYVLNIMVPQRERPTMWDISKMISMLGIGHMRDGELWVKNHGGLSIETQVCEAMWRQVGLVGSDHYVVRL